MGAGGGGWRGEGMPGPERDKDKNYASRNRAEWVRNHASRNRAEWVLRVRKTWEGHHQGGSLGGF